MELRFQTKEESNRQQLEAFLALPKAERVLRFFLLMEQCAQFPTKYQKEKSANFEIVIPIEQR